jgi:6-phosphofructokinase 1
MLGAMSLAPKDRVALLTSGGDAPGMNAALRGAARVGAQLGLEMVGIEDGYAGLMSGRAVPLDVHALDEASRRGGTILGTARSKTFATPEGQARARAAIKDMGLVALVVIGGNGSLTGARTLHGAPTKNGRGLLVGGIPASIDNDLACTSMAIGVDTAMNTIVEACDRICDTAAAHRRTFFVEVMGRDMGYLAMVCAIAAGADTVLVPEVGKTEDAIVDQIVGAVTQAYKSDTGKRRVLILKSEGVRLDTAELKRRVDARIGPVLKDVDTRVTVLGHVVRGGAPSAFDRLLGARLANAAMHELFAERSDFMVGWTGPGATGRPSEQDPYVVVTPLEQVLAETARLHAGETPIAAWRKRVYREVEQILEK